MNLPKIPTLPSITKVLRDLVILAAIYGSLVFAISILRSTSLENEQLAKDNKVLAHTISDYGKRISVLRDSLVTSKVAARVDTVVVRDRIAVVRSVAGDSAATVVQLDTLEAEHGLEVAHYERALSVSDSIISYQGSTITALYGIIRNKDTANEELRVALKAQVSQNRKLKLIGAAAALVVLVAR